MKNLVIDKIFLILITILFLLTSTWAQPIYFVDNQSTLVNESLTDGSELSQLALSSLGLYGIAADYQNNKIYYTNVVSDTIFQSEINGSNPMVILDNNTDGVDGPRGIVVDNKNDKIIWVEAISGRIRTAGLDGSNPTDLITGLSSPVDLALDLENDFLYWTENGIDKKKIYKSDLNGIIEDSIYIGTSQLGSIELDVENQKLYFIYLNHIYRINTDFSSPTIFVFLSSGSPRGLAIDRYSSKLFWSDIADSSLNSINLDGTLNSKIITELDHPMAISGDNPATLPVLAQLKVLLEGAYNGGSLMDDSLNTLIPTTSPYLENNRIVENIPSNIVDWALVELRESANGTAVVSKSVLVHKDGRIVADDGTSSTIRISADPMDYYLVIKHRNHLPIMSKNKITLSSN